MGFNVGDVVRIRKDDLLRGGETAKVLDVLAANGQQPSRAYIVEFASPPRRYSNNHRFLCCIYREEQLVGQENNSKTIS
jgi:hypothetical protein